MTDFALARFVQAPNGAEAVNRGLNQGLSTFLGMEQAKVAPELNQERLKSAKIDNELAPFLAGERLQGARLNNELRAARIDSLNGEERAREENAVKQGLVREIDFVLRGGPETERQARYAQSLGRVRQVIPGLQLPDNFDDQTRLILEKARVDLGGEIVEQPKAPEPLSPLGKLNRDVESGFVSDDQRAAELAPKPGQDKSFDNSTKLRNEFASGAKDFIKVRDAFGRIVASSNDPSPAGDLALIFNYMKVLDPGSTVREGEFATAQNSGGIPEQIRTAYNRGLTGERLAPERRADFVNRAERLFEQQATFHQARVSEFTRIAESFGLDPAQVIVDLTQGLPQTQDTPAEPARLVFNPATGALEPKQ